MLYDSVSLGFASDFASNHIVVLAGDPLETKMKWKQALGMTQLRFHFVSYMLSSVNV